MAGTVTNVGSAGKDGAALLCPGGGIHGILTHKREHTQAVVVPPAARGGVDNEGLTAVLEHRGALIDVGPFHRLPVVFGGGDHDPLGVDGAGVAHVGDVEVLLPVLVPLPARPEEVQFSVQLHDGAVNGPLVGGIGDLPHHLIGGAGILGRTLQDEHTVVGAIAVRGGHVDVPLTVQIVQLGCPQLLGVFRPLGGIEHRRALGDKGMEGGHLGHRDAAAAGVAVVVASLVEVDPGVTAPLVDGVLHLDVDVIGVGIVGEEGLLLGRCLGGRLGDGGPCGGFSGGLCGLFRGSDFGVKRDPRGIDGGIFAVAGNEYEEQKDRSQGGKQGLGSHRVLLG